MNSQNRSRVLQLVSSPESELRLLMHEIENFAPEILWMKGFQIYDWISSVKRAWWIRKEVGIPDIFAESVLEHCMNVKNAAEAVIKWIPKLIIDHARFPIMWKVHDMPEWHGILPDITPHCNYTKEQMQILERYAVLYIEQVLWEKWKEIVSLLNEYIEQKTPDSKNLFYIDKIDAWIKALDYEKLWYKKQVWVFHPYTLDKISESKYFTKIYEIMLEREFPNIPTHFKYFMLLELAWDYDKWREKILSTLEK